MTDTPGDGDDGEVSQSEELIEDCRYCGEPVDVEDDRPFKSVSDRFAHADCVADHCYGDRELFATTEGTFEMEAVTIIERTASKEKVCDSYWRARCPMCYTPHETETQEESARTDLLEMITSCCGPVEWLPPADYIEDCDICGDDHRESDGCLPISRRDPFPDAETHRYECTECDWEGTDASDFDNADGRCPECDTTAVRAIQLATDGGETPGDGTDDGEVSQSEEQFEYENWMEALKATARQFEDENDDLEAILEGEIGFHAFHVAKGDDVTRGAITAVHQALYDSLEELHIDADIVSHNRGEVTPESVADEVVDQITHNNGLYLSDRFEENIRNRVRSRIEKNMTRRRADR